MNRKKGWKYQKYIFVDNGYMYWTDTYAAFALKEDEAWVESLNVYSGNDYPAVKALFKNSEPSGDTVSLDLKISEVIFWKKTIDKEDGKQIIKTVCRDAKGNEFDCAFDVKNLENLFIILRADELTLKAKKKTCAGINSFFTENEYGKGIVVSVRTFEGGKNE